jgi:hypothetical protein
MVRLARTHEGSDGLADELVGRKNFPFSKIWPVALSAELRSLGSGGGIAWSGFCISSWGLGYSTIDPASTTLCQILYFALFFGALSRIAARCIGLTPALVFVTGITGLRLRSNLWTLSVGPLEQLAAAPDRDMC